MIPMKSRGAALLALTGDLEFNRDMRTQASKLGMHLNEYGLWRWVSHNPSPSPSSEDTDEPEEEDKGHWELMQADSEDTILHELGKSWIEPSKRNFSYLLDRMVKRPKGRPRLSVSPPQSGRGNHTLAGESDTPKKRGRPRKVVVEEEKTLVEEVPKRPRGRPRKHAPPEGSDDVDDVPKRPRGRPRNSV